MKAYPNHGWDKDKLEGVNKRATQKILKDVIAEIFTGHGTLLFDCVYSC